MFGVIRREKTPFFNNVQNSILSYQNVRPPVNQSVYYTIPQRYFNQIPQSACWISNDGYVHANIENMKNNFVAFWSDNVNCQSSLKQQEAEEFRKIFKNLVDLAAKDTEETDPTCSMIFDALGFVMADNVADALHKAISFKQKYDNAK